MATTPAWKLRHLATRAKRVQERRASESPVLAVYAVTLPPKADAFVAAYDAAAKYENTWRREMREGKGAVATLVRHIQSWLPLLARDIPGFDPSTFGDKPDSVKNTNRGVVSGSALVIDSALGGKYELTLEGGRLSGVYTRGTTLKVPVTFTRS